MIFFLNVFCFAESIGICFYCKIVIIIKSKLFWCVVCGWKLRQLFQRCQCSIPFWCVYHFGWWVFFHPYTCMLYTVKMTLFHIFLCFRRVKRDNYLQSTLEGLETLEYSSIIVTKVETRLTMTKKRSPKFTVRFCTWIVKYSGPCLLVAFVTCGHLGQMLRAVAGARPVSQHGVGP